MKRSLSLWPLFLLFFMAGAQAQMYKWVGPDGKVVYSDTPPPPTAKQVERKTLSSGAAADADLPFELAEAAKNNPVTLYTTDNCEPCNDGRKFLNARGIPFAEKTVSSNADIAKLKQSGGESQLPLLVVGRNKKQGFESGGWNAALTAAGYPESSKLPKNYRNRLPESAASEPKVAADSPAKSEDGVPGTAPAVSELPPPTGKAPPGFRF